MMAANFGGNPLLEANFLLVFLFLSFLDTKKILRIMTYMILIHFVFLSRES